MDDELVGLIVYTRSGGVEVHKPYGVIGKVEARGVVLFALRKIDNTNGRLVMLPGRVYARPEQLCILEENQK